MPRIARAQSQASAQPPAAAQGPAQQEPIEPDRPDVTNGPHLVDAGLLQLEVGALYNRSHASHDTGTPTTIRVGLSDWLELRVGGDGFLTSTDPERRVSGIGNVQLGAKLRLWADPGGIALLSILPSVNLPAASEGKGLGSGQADYTITVLTGMDLSTRGHVDVNYGAGMIGAGTGRRRFPQHLASASGNVEIPGPVTPYAEVFWFSRQDPRGGSVMAIDTGATYVISPRLAIDGGFQRGLSPDAPQLSVFGGVSVIVGNVLGDYGVHARQRQAARRTAARAARGK